MTCAAAPKLHDHTFSKTREELEKFLLDTIAPSLEQAWSERDASEQKLAEKDRDLEEERKARKDAEKKASEKEKENEVLRKILEDERNKNKTHEHKKFGSSRRMTEAELDAHTARRGMTNKMADARELAPLRSLIETCKLWKVSVCENFNKVFTAFSVGRTDYDNLMPWCLAYYS